MKIGVTSFERKNMQRGDWDNAGSVDWSSNVSAKVFFGTDEVRLTCLFTLAMVCYAHTTAGPHWGSSQARNLGRQDKKYAAHFLVSVDDMTFGVPLQTASEG